MCLVILTLEIIPKTIWNCIIAFFDLLIKTRHAFDWGYNLLQFFICYWEKFINLSSLLQNLTYFSPLNSFSFTFSVFLKSLNNYFFRWLVASLFLADFQWYYTIWSFNFFTASSCFPYFSWRSGFSGSRFFRAQVFKGSGFSGSGSRIWVHVLEVALTHYAKLAQKSYFFKKTCFSWILNNFDQLLRFCEFVKQLLIFPSK